VQRTRWERLRRAFWALPAAGLAAGVALGLGLPALERGLGGGGGVLAFGGEPAAARGLLSTIATLTVSIIGLAFSVTLVALTLAAQQLSPRVLRTFRGDRLNQSTLAVFLGLAVYALLVLRSIRVAPEAFVPGAAITLALAVTVGALGLFVAFVNNIVISLQPSTVIRRIAKDGRAALAEPREGEPARALAPAAGPVIAAERAGYVQRIDAPAACKALAAAGRRATLCPQAGDFVGTGDPLVRLDGGEPPGEDLAARLRATVSLGQERSLDQDAAFPIRQLADIALKALSPGSNDPTTAENALDSMGELFGRAAAAELGPRELRDASGGLRLGVPGPDLGALVRLGIEQARGAIGRDPVVALAVLEALGRAHRAAPAEPEPARQAGLVVEQFDATGAPADDRARVRERHRELFAS